MKSYRTVSIFFPLIIVLFLFSVFAPSIAFADSPTYTYSDACSQAISNSNSPSSWLLQPSQVVTIPDSGGTHGLQYDSGGNLIVRSATLSSYIKDNYVGQANYTTYGAPSVNASWVTTGNDFTSFYDVKGGNVTNTDLIKVVERGLGMNNDASHNAIFELSVAPNNNTIMRPTKNPDIATYNSSQYGNSDVTYPFIQPSTMSDTVYNNFKTYYEAFRTKSYTQPFDATKSFPYTQLAYTFFWGYGSKTVLADITGMSEFIIPGGTSANIIGIYATTSYIYTKNGGQYGNGYANFNITGNCDTVWAGHVFQQNVSRSASSPNQITIASSATMSGGEGILVWSLNYDITNNGTITGATTKKFQIAGTENIAILFEGDSSATYGNPITSGINKVTNSGIISSPGTAIESYAGNTSIINNPGATISGDTHGIWLLAGNNNINNGGTITSAGTAAIRIGSGTTRITNTGTINGNLLLDANSTAALDVMNGNVTLSSGGVYTQGAGSTLKLTAYSPVNYGSVTAAGGAALSASSGVSITTAGYIPNNTVFTVVNTSGAGIGNVPGSISSTSPVFSFTGSGTTNNLVITATRAHPYNTLASTANGSAVGSSLESLGANATGDMATVLNALDSMTSSKQISDNLETMHPDMSSGDMEGTQAITNQFLSSISSRIGFVRNGLTETGISTGDMFQGAGVWFQGLGSHALQDTRKGIEGFQYNTFGTMVGADKIIGDHVRAGLAGGYGYADIKSKTPGSPQTGVNCFQGTIYGSYDSTSLSKAREKGKYSEKAVRTQGENLWYVDGMFGVTQNNYDSRRQIYLGDSVRVANAAHYGQQYTAQMESGYTMVFKKTKALEITPFALLQYSYLRMNRYSETGADSLDLTVSGEGFNSFTQGLGTKLAYPILSDKYGTFIPAVKCAWLYDYMGETFVRTASFDGGGPSFQTTGVRPSQHGMLMGASIIFLNKGNMTVSGNYDWEIKDRFGSHTYYGTVRMDF